jgi:hypothetical protein
MNTPNLLNILLRYWSFALIALSLFLGLDASHAQMSSHNPTRAR